MSVRTGIAIALVSAGMIAAPMAPASADDGRHLAFGLGAAVGALALILTSPFRAVAAPAPAPVYAAPPAAYYPPPPVAYYAPPAYVYAPAPRYYYYPRY
jgi:hypothetical protein